MHPYHTEEIICRPGRETWYVSDMYQELAIRQALHGGPDDRASPWPLPTGPHELKDRHVFL